MQSKKMLLIGSYSPENEGKPEIIDRDYYRQGWIFKDEDAFQNRPDDVCYIPELSDEKYTRNDILKILAGDEELAKQCSRSWIGSIQKVCWKTGKQMAKLPGVRIV